MNVDASSDKNWLVKSSGMILGPYSLEEVIQALQERRISVIDEIRTQDQRWGFIREHKKFVEIIQFIREQQGNSKEDTGSTFVGTKTGTKTITNNDEMTPTPLVTEAEDLTFKSTEVFEAPPIRPATSTTPSSTYAFGSDQRIQKTLHRSRKRTATIAWVIFMALVICIFSFETLNKKDTVKSLGFDDYLRLAKTNKTLGNFEKSLDFFKKAEALKTLDPSSQMQMIPLLMVVENQNVQARHMLEMISQSKDLDGKIKGEVESLLALSYLREDQLDEAQKRYRSIKNKDPKNEPAQINLIEISILQGQFESAYQDLTRLIRDGFKDPFLSLYRAVVAYRSFDNRHNQDKLEQSLQDLKRFTAKSQDYRPEVFLLEAALQKKMGHDLDIGESLKALLQTYPDLTKEHQHDYLVDRSILNWNYLANICHILLDGVGDSPLYKGLAATCAYEQADFKTATDLIDKARTQFSTESILYGLQAFLLVKSNRASEAKAVFQLPKASESDVLMSVQARLCQENKDLSCAEKNWKALQEKQPNNVESFYGLAWIALQKGQKDMAADIVTRGLLMSSNYRPLIELKDQLNEQ